MEITVTEQLRYADIYPEEAKKLAQKLHKKKEDIPLFRKYYVEEIKEEDIVSEEDRTIISRISCANKDRDGESLLPSGVNLKNYEKNPIVCWGHSYSDPKHFVGKNVWIKSDENGLIAKTVFSESEFADQVFKAYTEDVGGTGPLLKGFSVGFIPHAWDDAETKDIEDGAPVRTYTDWELLEYSCVGIPCSPESLTLAHAKGIISESFKDKIAKDYEIELEDEEIEVELESDEQEILANVKLVDDIQDDTVSLEINTKAADLEGNPSVWDIQDAINRALPNDRDRWVRDLYPFNYPDGNVIVSVWGVEDGLFLYDYTYNDGEVELGEAVEVESSYSLSRGFDIYARLARIESLLETNSEDPNETKDYEIEIEDDDPEIEIISDEPKRRPKKSVLTEEEAKQLLRDRIAKKFGRVG